MRILFFPIAVLLLITLACDKEERDYYQLKFYQLENESQEARMDKYLEGAYIPGLKRAGIENVGVFKPIEEDTVSGNIIIVLVPFRSLEQFNKLPSILNQDAAYLADGKDYIESAHDQPPYARIQSMLLKSFRLMPDYHVPDHATSPVEQIYELRSYEGATEKLYERKVEMFNEGGEIALFEKLEFNAVFYSEVISGANMPNLIYMISFENEKSHQEHWDAFRNHPDWDRLKNMERYANTVSHIDRWLLHPTDYSGI